MTVVIENPDQERMSIQARRDLGHDRHDEVWDGVYIVSPDPDNEHQRVVVRLSRCFLDAVEDHDLGQLSAGGNVTDRTVDWTQNFRCPDVAVYLRGSTAQDLVTHWQGGPDSAFEVLSKGDRARKKLAFYASVGTRELLLIDRAPWGLELYRLEGGGMRLVGKSSPEAPEILASVVLPLSMRLAAGDPRPTVETRHADGVQTWSA